MVKFPRIPPLPPPQPNACFIFSPVHLLTKMHWDLEQLGDLLAEAPASADTVQHSECYPQFSDSYA
jgi:hypothetical protein